jgi:hypothetical protein
VSLQPYAFRGQLVEIRRSDIGAVKTDVFPAEIIREDVDYVWFRGLGCLRGASKELC